MKTSNNLSRILRKATGHYILKKFIIGDEIPPSKEHPSQALLEYRKTGNIPPWVLVNDLTFGDTLNLYSALQDKYKKEIISIAFPNVKFSNRNKTTGDERNIEFVSSVMHLIKSYRDGLAHGDLLNKIQGNQELKWLQIDELINHTGVVTEAEHMLGIGRSDLLSLFISLWILTDNYSTENLFTISNIVLEQLGLIFGNENLSNARKAFKTPQIFQRD